MIKKSLTVMIILVFVYTIAGIVFSSNELQYDKTTWIEVESGDTLWKIASSLNNGKYNTHKIITEIKDINDLDISCIYPGQKLKVPQINE